MGRWADEPTHTARHRAWRLIQVADLAHRAASLANFITFLRDGKFRSPWERAARARLVYAAPDAARVVSFEYLNRQLVWQELSELALFVLPIVSAHARRWREAARAAPTRERRRRRRHATPPSPRAPTPDGSAASAESRVHTGSAVRGVRAVARDAPVRAGAVRPRGLLLLRAAARAAEGASDGARFRCAERRRGARDAARQARGARLTRRVE